MATKDQKFGVGELKKKKYRKEREEKVATSDEEDYLENNASGNLEEMAEAQEQNKKDTMEIEEAEDGEDSDEEQKKIPSKESDSEDEGEEHEVSELYLLGQSILLLEGRFPLVFLKCGHQFKGRYSYNWIKRKRYCPACRQAL